MDQIAQQQAAEADGMIAQAMAQSQGAQNGGMMSGRLREQLATPQTTDFSNQPPMSPQAQKKHKHGFIVKGAILVTAAVAIKASWPVIAAFASGPVLPYTLLIAGGIVGSRYIVKHKLYSPAAWHQRMEDRRERKLARAEREQGLDGNAVNQQTVDEPTQQMEPVEKQLTPEERQASREAEMAEEAAAAEAEKRGYTVTDNRRLDAESQDNVRRPWGKPEAPADLVKDLARQRGYYRGMFKVIESSPLLRQKKTYAQMALLKYGAADLDVLSKFKLDEKGEKLRDALLDYRVKFAQVLDANLIDVANDVARAALTPGRARRTATAEVEGRAESKRGPQAEAAERTQRAVRQAQPKGAPQREAAVL